MVLPLLSFTKNSHIIEHNSLNQIQLCAIIYYRGGEKVDVKKTNRQLRAQETRERIVQAAKALI